MKDINIKATESSKYDIILDSTQVNSQGLKFGYEESSLSRIKNIVKWMNAIHETYEDNSICFRVMDEDLLFDEVVIQVTKNFRVRYKSAYPLDSFIIREVIDQIENLLSYGIEIYNAPISIKSLNVKESLAHSEYIHSIRTTGRIIEFSVPLCKLSESSRLMMTRKGCILDKRCKDGFLITYVRMDGTLFDIILNIGEYYGLHGFYRLNDRIYVQLYDNPSVTEHMRPLIGLRSNLIFKSIQDNNSFKIKLVEEILRQSDKIILMSENYL